MPRRLWLHGLATLRPLAGEGGMRSMTDEGNGDTPDLNRSRATPSSARRCRAPSPAGGRRRRVISVDEILRVERLAEPFLRDLVERAVLRHGGDDVVYGLDERRLALVDREVVRRGHELELL